VQLFGSLGQLTAAGRRNSSVKNPAVNSSSSWHSWLPVIQLLLLAATLLLNSLNALHSRSVALKSSGQEKKKFYEINRDFPSFGIFNRDSPECDDLF
jgi:hypothetical protein